MSNSGVIVDIDSCVDNKNSLWNEHCGIVNKGFNATFVKGQNFGQSYDNGCKLSLVYFYITNTAESCLAPYPYLYLFKWLLMEFSEPCNHNLFFSE